VNCGFNAAQAGIAIGMSQRSAHANAHRYVAAIRNRLSLQQVLAEAGLDPRKIAEKLAQLIDCLEPKWNPAEKRWDLFDNATAQLEAVKQIARLLNLYPAQPLKVESEQVNVIIDVPL
jgi:hypothetical protein